MVVPRAPRSLRRRPCPRGGWPRGSPTRPYSYLEVRSGSGSCLISAGFLNLGVNVLVSGFSQRVRAVATGGWWWRLRRSRREARCPCSLVRLLSSRRSMLPSPSSTTEVGTRERFMTYFHCEDFDSVLTEKNSIPLLASASNNGGGDRNDDPESKITDYLSSSLSNTGGFKPRIIIC